MEKITAREALEAGKTRYFTGKPCKYGHLLERMVRNGACIGCMKEQAKRYKDKHPEKVAATRSRYRSSEKGLRKGAQLANKIRLAYPEREKLRQIKFYERKEERLALEAGRPRSKTCDICWSNERIVFDHCHNSGKFRGWLCDRCNRTLGQVKESIPLLRKLIAYLEKHNGKIDK